MSNNFNQLPNQILVRAIHTAVKGRARYKVNGLYRSEALKKYLEFRLSQEEGVAQVRANYLTGNVLVISAPDFSPNAIAKLIQGIVLDYRKQPLKSSEKTADISTASTATAQKQKRLPWHILEIDSITIAKLVLGAGAVCTLVFGAGLLHRANLDQSILLAIRKLHTPILDRIMLSVTFLGDPLVLLSICLGSKIGLLADNRRSEATTLGIAAVGAIGLNYWLKQLFARTRPALWQWIIDVDHYSFPSGHAMVSIVTYGFIGYILANRFPQWRRQIFALSVVLIVAVGFSRLYLGVHWATDVLAGYAAGLVWLIACILGSELWQKYYLSAKHLQQKPGSVFESESSWGRQLVTS